MSYALVLPAIVVVVYVPSYPFPHLHPIVKRVKIDVLVLDGTPKTLNPYVVLASPLFFSVKAADALARNSDFQLEIITLDTLKRSDNCANVSCPFSASMATWALNSAVKLLLLLFISAKLNFIFLI